MAKLSELFDPEKPGSVKVSYTQYNYFIPYYLLNNKYHGIMFSITGRISPYNVTFYDYEVDDWELYEDPKPKTVLYEWIIRLSSSEYWELSTELLTEEQAKISFSDCEEYIKTGRSFEV